MRQQIKMWNDGTNFSGLVSDTTTKITGRKLCHPKHQCNEARFRSFSSQLLSGHCRKAVRFLTNRDQGGVLDPSNTCTKSGQPVLDVLKDKHPDTCLTEAHGAYNDTPAVIPLDISADHSEKVASKLLGSSGVDGIDGMEPKHWMLWFGTISMALCQVMADLTHWISNNTPSWVAYWSLMACQLVAFDKQPGTRPVGIRSMF